MVLSCSYSSNTGLDESATAFVSSRRFPRNKNSPMQSIIVRYTHHASVHTAVQRLAIVMHLVILPEMKTFPDSVKFRYQWRPYQARTLSELEGHLDDSHLHIVAAPGSGKTVLGLEVTRRLNKPALILAPTVAIRDQWVDRLVGMFCEPGTAIPPWILRDVRAPGFLTVMTYQGLFSACFTVANGMRAMEEQIAIRGVEGALIAILIICALAVMVALPRCLKALWLFLRHAPVASSIRQIGKALLRALVEADVIETRPAHIKVVTRRQSNGAVRCTLQGASTRERTVFLEALDEVLGPIKNPRYLLTRKTPLLRWLRRDYHVVPKVLGRRKGLAESFQRLWSKYVGPTELIYTRNEEGRRLLLQARGHSLSSAFVKRSRRLRAWQ